jgi:hypothetical protein
MFLRRRAARLRRPIGEAAVNNAGCPDRRARLWRRCAHRSLRVSPPDDMRWDGNPTGVGGRETIARATSHLLPVPRRPHLPLRSSGRRSRRKRADQGGPAAGWQDGPLRPGQGRRELPLIGRFSLWCATLEPSYRHSVGCGTALNQWVRSSSPRRLTASGADTIDCIWGPAVHHPWSPRAWHSVGDGYSGLVRAGTACDGPLIGMRHARWPAAPARSRAAAPLPAPLLPPSSSCPGAGQAAAAADKRLQGPSPSAPLVPPRSHLLP